MPEKPEVHLGERPAFRGIAVYLQNQIQADIINPCDKNDTSMIAKKKHKNKTSYSYKRNFFEALWSAPTYEMIRSLFYTLRLEEGPGL